MAQNKLLTSVLLIFLMHSFITVSTQGDYPNTSDKNLTALSSWILPPESKIRLDLVPEEEAIGTNSATTYLARNEEEYIQIALQGPMDNIDVNIKSGFTGFGKIEFYQEWFVQITQPSWDSLEGNYPSYLPTGKSYADGLVPFNDPYDSSNHPGKGFSIKSGEFGAILVKFSAPKDQAAGIYTGVIEVSSTQGSIDISIQVVVFDFTIPDATLDTLYYVEYGYQSVASIEGLEEESTTHNEYRNRYYKFLADYGLFPGNILPLPTYNKDTGSISFGDAEPILDYLLDHGMKAVAIPNYYDDIAEEYPDGTSKAKFDDSEWRSNAVTYYRNWANWLDSRGLLEGSYAFIYDETEYVSDEPYHRGRDGYDRVWEWADLLYEANPKIRFLLADNILPLSALEEYKDVRKHDIPLIIDVYGADIDTPGIQEYIDGYLADGKDLWYVPNDNYDYIDYPGTHPRVMGAYSYLHKITGIEAWDTISWPEESTDPWVDDPFNTFGNGAGAIIYPGKHWNVKGPLPSLRLELNREAMDDHAYLSILDDLGAADLAHDVAQKLVPSDIMWIDHANVTPSTIQQAKSLMAAQILRLNNSNQIDEPYLNLPRFFDNETVEISGTVLYNNKPVPYIQVTDGIVMDSTDANGKYRLTTIPGNRTINAHRYDRRSMIYQGEMQDYDDGAKQVELSGGTMITVDISLDQSIKKMDLLSSFEEDFTYWTADGDAEVIPVDNFEDSIQPTDGNQMLQLYVEGDSEITVNMNFTGDAGQGNDEIWMTLFTGNEITYTIIEVAAGENWEFYREIYLAPGGPFTLVLPVDQMANQLGSLAGKTIPLIFSVQTTIGEDEFESDSGAKTFYIDRMVYVHSSESSSMLTEGYEETDWGVILGVAIIIPIVIVTLVTLWKKKRWIWRD